MTKYTQPSYHVVRFNLKRNPDLIPWLKAQHSEPESLAQLIRLAQAMSGNRDWLRAAPKIEGRMLLNTNNSPSQHTSLGSNKDSLRTSNKSNMANPTEQKHKSTNINPSSSSSMNLKRNGFDGF